MAPGILLPDVLGISGLFWDVLIACKHVYIHNYAKGLISCVHSQQCKFISPFFCDVHTSLLRKHF